MDVIGTLKEIYPIEAVSDKFKKRDFVLTMDHAGKYPQHVSFQLTQDKCNLLDNYKLGTEIQVHFNLRGREWNGPQGVKYFNTLEAWRVINLAAEHQASGAPVFNGGNPRDNEDLPF